MSRILDRRIEPIGSGYGSTMLLDLHAHEMARLQEHSEHFVRR